MTLKMYPTLPQRAAIACLLAANFLVAGCAGPADGPDPSDGGNTAAPAGVFLADLASQGCEYNDLIWFVPVVEAQALLPPGFTARLFMDGVGALVINAFDCGGAFAWNGWDLFVFSETPTMPDVVEAFDAANRTPRGTGEHYELDLYMLAAHTDHAGLAAVFGAGGIPVGPGSHSRESVAMGDVAVAAGTLASGGVVLGQALLTGTQVDGQLGGQLTAHHRQWRVTPEGTLLVERVMTKEGGPVELTQGPGACALAPTTLFFAVVGPRSCNFSQDAIGGMEWTGGAYFFPGVAPEA